MNSITIVDSQQPALDVGQYQVTVEHDVPTAGKATPGQQGTATFKFYVNGPRFALNPQDIIGVFPPPGGLGDHSDVLPHIQFQRSTLPWERKLPNVDGPWLALLVLYEGESGPPSNPPGADTTNPRAWTLGDLTSPSTDRTIRWDGITLETEQGQSAQDPVSIIEVDAQLLRTIFPGPATRKMLTHVRSSAGTPAGEERAVIIANRLPRAGASSVVHLVSLEGVNVDAAIQDASASYKVRLVSLYSWRFTCASADHNLIPLLRNLNRNLLLQFVAATDDLPCLNSGDIANAASAMDAFKQIGRPLSTGATCSPMEKDKHWLVQDGVHAFHLVRDGANIKVLEQMPGVLRLPHNADVSAEALLTLAGVPLGHATRYGNRTVSFYHGPLMAGNIQAPAMKLPVQVADELLYAFQTYGLLDVSYAAAWELGRLLTLQNKAVVSALYNWKRQHAQAKKLADAEQLLTHLPLGRTSAPADLPDKVLAWFQDLALLRGVPFRYLVADERMLPPESLRLFQIDSTWIACLLDGAYSLGRVLPSDYIADLQHTQLMTHGAVIPATGLLLRSAAVSGWPDLVVDGLDASGADANTLRADKPAANMLLCLFAKQVSTVNIHLKPEALHFGFGPAVSSVPTNNGAVDWQKWDPDLFKSGAINSSQIAPKVIAMPVQVQFTVGD